MADPLSSIADLRKSYERAELDEQASQADPMRQFQQWLQEAIDAQVPEPNAMTLATVDAQLRPSTRVVLTSTATSPTPTMTAASARRRTATP